MPEKFRQYDLVEILSKKYSHVTYLASPTDHQKGHDESEHQVILTVFTSSLFSLPHERKHLLQKVRRIQELEHPNLVPILDMGLEGKQPFVVRKYLPYDSLRSRLQTLSPDRLELGDALMIISQIGQALAYAHKHYLLHGNLKPENILFNANGEAILTDFSLVERKDAILRDQTSEEYAFCYLAPEQFAGTCDARSDQYALGSLAYELISGNVPFATRSLASIMGHQNNTLPSPLRESVTDLPPSLDTAVLKTLAKDPDERFFDFALFLEIIQAVLSPLSTSPSAHSVHSHKKRTIFQSAQNVSPLAHKHAAASIASQPPELSVASSSAEVNVIEPTNTASMSQVSIPEWAGIIPVSESLESALESYQFPFSLSEEVDPTYSIENGEEVDDLSEINVSVQQNANAVTEEILPLTKSSDIGGSQSVRPQHKRRRALGLAGLLSMIAIVTASAFWLSRTSTPDTSSHAIQKATQATTIHTTNIRTIQSSVQPTSSPTAQPSAQATNTPVAQSSSPTPASTVRPIPIPTPTPTPTPAISYEADSSQNTLAGGANVVGCSVCSDQHRVAYIGLNGGTAGTLQLNNVKKNVAGKYTLTIYYIIAGSDQLTMDISVNGGPAVALNVPATPNGDTVGVASTTISLNAGNNTIEFSNPSAPAPDMDRIVV